MGRGEWGGGVTVLAHKKGEGDVSRGVRDDRSVKSVAVARGHLDGLLGGGEGGVRANFGWGFEDGLKGVRDDHGVKSVDAARGQLYGL